MFRTALLVCAVALGFAAWSWLSPPKVASVTATLERGDVESSVTAIGTLRPRHYVDVGAQVSGQITRLHVQPGDVVEPNQLLVEIDASVQKAAFEAGRAALAGLRAQIEEQQAVRRLSEHRLTRQRKMAEEGATRDEDVQTAEAELAAASARVENLKAQVAQTEATLKADQTRLNFTRIYAPIAGTVLSVKAREGQTLNATYQTPEILRIADLSSMTVWAEVSEADVQQVKPGLPVWFVTLGGHAQDKPRRWTSTVRQVLPAPYEPEKKAEATGGGSTDAPGKQAVTYTVLFDVDNRDGALMPQMTAQVSFVLAEARNVVLAPLSALPLEPGQPDRSRARVMRIDGTHEPREVRLGVRNRSIVEVVEGLAAGETLIVGEEPVQERKWIQW